jgi:hypothetical protein
MTKTIVGSNAAMPPTWVGGIASYDKCREFPVTREGVIVLTYGAIWAHTTLATTVTSRFPCELKPSTSQPVGVA